MARRAGIAAVAVLAMAVAGCGSSGTTTTAQSSVPSSLPQSGSLPPTTTPKTTTTPEEKQLLGLLVPKGVPTRANGESANPKDVAVVKRWLAALTHGDVQAAADTFADGAVVQNLEPPTVLKDRADRIAFNDAFPCGAELVTASSVKGFLVVTYRLTDRTDSPCDGPGGSAAGTIKVEHGKMTQWYRLPDPATTNAKPTPVV